MEQNKQPLLSICIPTYNRASYLEGAILNIITDNAFGDEVEIIISDNASTDNTEEIAKNTHKNIIILSIIKTKKIFEIKTSC